MKFKIIEELSNFNFGTEFVNAGRAYEKKVTEKDVDAKELEMGIAVEMEHTVNKDIAKRIALDHLAELKDYYTRLAKMEKKGKEAQTEKSEDTENDESDAEDKKEDNDEDEKEDKENSLKV